MFVYNIPSVCATDRVSVRINIVSWAMDQSESSRGREESKGQFKHGDKFLTTELVRYRSKGKRYSERVLGTQHRSVFCGPILIVGKAQVLYFLSV